MGEFEHLNWLHESMQLDDSDVWNQIVDGLCTDKVLALSVGPNSERVDFAMVWGQDWFVPFPIFNDELICGYSILCDCTHEGVQRDRKPHRWEEIEARGELVGYVNRKDFVKCPHCDVSFKVTARSSWNGCRHLKCWGCIKLLRKEDIVE
ncbi:MAG: hypothetical protein NTY98_15630, partial [Verrucomicrobia bacterium]|nr:hypothetical protein [Verrucomicrobiota bacterium]